MGAGLRSAARAPASARPTFAQAIRIVEAALLTRLAAPPAADPMVTARCALLARDPRQHASSRYSATAGCTPQQFIRRFEAGVGLTPKRYARVLRFAVLLPALVRVGPRDWAQDGRRAPATSTIAPDPRVQATGGHDARRLRTGPGRSADACADRRGDASERKNLQYGGRRIARLRSSTRTSPHRRSMPLATRSMRSFAYLVVRDSARSRCASMPAGLRRNRDLQA